MQIEMELLVFFFLQGSVIKMLSIISLIKNLHKLLVHNLYKYDLSISTLIICYVMITAGEIKLVLPRTGLQRW